jgi:D-tyrosyl-tRNA(Tyr) deacylase
MIALIQRVSSARVTVDEETCGAIGVGLLALIGIERGDGALQGTKLLERVLDYRVFPDASGRMNRSLRETGGGLLLVPQFTLVADTSTGTRAGFSKAAEPVRARELFGQLVAEAGKAHAKVACGQFGAHMQVSLVNDGPVTFWLETSTAP